MAVKVFRNIRDDCSAERLQLVSPIEKTGIIGGNRKGKKGAAKR
jgi:hypothetical protein